MRRRTPIEPGSRWYHEFTLQEVTVVQVRNRKVRYRLDPGLQTHIDLEDRFRTMYLPL